MTSKLTRERLEKIKSWRETYGAGSNVMLPAEEAEALALIALAAMDSEPVIVVGDDGGDALSYRRLIQSFEPGTKLYRHAQPAPVVPEEKPIPNTLSMYAVDAVAAIAEVKGWNACRAAMLQELKKSAGTEATCRSNENVQVLHTKSPVQSDCCPAQNHVSPEQNSVAPAQSGNSPAIPDGYVLVPKEATKEILDEFDSIIDYGAEDSVDAWHRLLAAATQEVKP
ncbi:DUF551 domain-containing protein [Klebsiella pneumoniae]|uniref:hypothetical protein n=1 Tax=Klebsiella pneumoniae TaxID=573 RepID=UPI00081BDF9C|nr:hypothetical protein [Klebsiella pneumoniae]MEC6295886.1 DUF551 domain-containing protein [Klebsiella pneumoniae]OCW01354.1 hypothetical protein A9P96_17540 [Klebsiella pneumoniae]RGL46034.1 DUF551 domain-containing protein [Klebsiella pneumoniae]